MTSSQIPDDDEQRELMRLLAKARPLKDEAGDLHKVHQAIEVEQNSPDGADLQQAQRSFDKWRVLHKYIHARPFALQEGLARSDQWRAVGQKIAALKAADLDDWICLQIEVADNRERGIYDLRIRRDGPCFLILLEYVANKKRTALAVLHWAREQAKTE